MVSFSLLSDLESSWVSGHGGIASGRSGFCEGVLLVHIQIGSGNDSVRIRFKGFAADQAAFAVSQFKGCAGERTAVPVSLFQDNADTGIRDGVGPCVPGYPCRTANCIGNNIVILFFSPE